MERKLRVGVIFGGRSGEHEISLLSARSIVDALDRRRYEPVLLGIDPDGRWHLHDAAHALLATPGAPLHLDPTAPSVAVSPGDACVSMVTTQASAPAVGSLDVVFPVLHGTYGEDGTVQGLLEMADVPYVGSGVLGSSAGMDKDVAKRLLRSVGLPVVDWFVVRAHQNRSAADVASEVESGFGWPVFVKPANMGSSVGVSKARKADELAAALVSAFRYDNKVLIERGHAVRELECGVLGNDRPRASVVGEIVPTHEFYSYTAKYLDEGGAHLRIPAALTPGQSEEIRRMSVEAFAALELSGLARVDFFMDKIDGSLFLNEVNTMPGFTSISMYPKLWEASGVPYAALVDQLIALAMERAVTRRGLSTKFGPGRWAPSPRCRPPPPPRERGQGLRRWERGGERATVARAFLALEHAEFLEQRAVDQPLHFVADQAHDCHGPRADDLAQRGRPGLGVAAHRGRRPPAAG